MKEGSIRTACASCGASIVEFPADSGRWAHRSETSDSIEERRTYEFCCQVLYDTSGDPPYKVLRADYHHPAGTEQRHFVIAETL